MGVRIVVYSCIDNSENVQICFRNINTYLFILEECVEPRRRGRWYRTLVVWSPQRWYQWPAWCATHLFSLFLSVRLQDGWVISALIFLLIRYHLRVTLNSGRFFSDKSFLKSYLSLNWLLFSLNSLISFQISFKYIWRPAVVSEEKRGQDFSIPISFTGFIKICLIQCFPSIHRYFERPLA